MTLSPKNGSYSCRVPLKRWYSNADEAIEEAKRNWRDDGIHIFIYYCRWTPCAYMNTIHLTKNIPREPRDVKVNSPLFELYRNKGNGGKGNPKSKSKRNSLSRRRKLYRETGLPIQSWENEGGAIR